MDVIYPKPSNASLRKSIQLVLEYPKACKRDILQEPSCCTTTTPTPHPTTSWPGGRLQAHPGK
ncbi:hypothetical protein AMATHDRAFT_68484 [Amanita thiersii Skay4041]|uniref:Uncharacterized protein n=1 Tax=Amanita thiersii Skay4041 TaxID=703135 RepID=A0A2A9NFQ0_9AGAR|nr:hypothetical protein AMATHDRAFT_68484 [Amanita thiersii Skay4041]